MLDLDQLWSDCLLDTYDKSEDVEEDEGDFDKPEKYGDTTLLQNCEASLVAPRRETLDDEPFISKTSSNSVDNVAQPTEFPTPSMYPLFPPPERPTKSKSTGMSREEALVKLIERTRYPIMQENGQRRYGPPPDWVGPPPARGCEIFIGKIPRDCFEDELVPVFESVGKVYMFRLMMDFSGCNRGYGFCIYTNREDTRRAVSKLDAYEIRKSKPLGVCFSVDNCRLFVGGIPKTRTKEEILREMKKATEGVKDVIVYPSVVDKTKNRGFAFVEYESHKAAAMARRKLIPGRIHLWGHQVAVDWAEPEREVDEDVMSKVRILYVRNLMLDTTEETLREQFNLAAGSKNAVERVKKMKDYAFIHFRDRMLAANSLARMDGSILDGSRIEVNWAKPADKSDGLRIQRSDTMTASMNRNVEDSLLLNLFNLSMKPQPSVTTRGSQALQMVGSCLPNTVGNLALPIVGEGSSVLPASFAPTMLSNATEVQRMGTFTGHGPRAAETDINNTNFFNKLLMTQLQGRMNSEQNERRIREAFIVSQILNGSKQPNSRVQSLGPSVTKYQMGNSNDATLPLGDRELPPKLMSLENTTTNLQRMLSDIKARKFLETQKPLAMAVGRHTTPEVNSSPTFPKFLRSAGQCLPPTPQRPPSLSLMPSSQQPHQQPRSPWMSPPSIVPTTEKAVSLPSPVGLGKPQVVQDRFTAFRAPSTVVATTTNSYADFGMFAPTNNRPSTMDSWQNDAALRSPAMKTDTECNMFKNNQFKTCSEPRPFQQAVIKNFDTTVLESVNLLSASSAMTMNQPPHLDEVLRRRQLEAPSMFENSSPFISTTLGTTKESGLNIMYPTAVSSNKTSGWDNCDNQRTAGLSTPGLIRSPIGKFNFCVDELIVDDENQFHFNTSANFP